VILGDRAVLAFELEPVAPTWERRSSADRGPWARLALWVRERCLTKAVETDLDRVVHGVHVPLLPIADWLVRNIRAIAFEESPMRFPGGVDLHDVIRSWDDAPPPSGLDNERWEEERYEWYSRHFMLAGAQGAMLPDLALVRADGRLWLSWSRTRYSGPRSLEYLEPAGMEAVAWEGAVSAIEEFAGYVASEVARTGVDPQPAWVGMDRPLAAALTCTALEAVQWIAPEAASWLPEIGVAPASAPEESVALQALRDLDLRSGHEGVVDSLRRLECETRKPAHRTSLPEMRSKLSGNATEVETVGRDAARFVRREWGLDGRPASEAFLKSRLDELGARVETPSSGGASNWTAVGARRDGGALVVLFKNRRTEKDWARRMELARAIGHLLLDAETSKGALGAASSATASGPRRRRSGAFAAELLLPTQGVVEILAGRDPGEPGAFQEIMDRYSVGARATAYHLWNQRLFLSEEDRDRLIDEFASTP